MSKNTYLHTGADGWPYYALDVPPTKGPSTYLHAGAGKGWPHDHKAEDTFELPKINTQIEGAPYYLQEEIEDAKSEKAAQEAFLDSPVFTPAALAGQPITDIEYRAVYGTRGEALLIRTETKLTEITIANFDTFADAEKAAEALNNHEGY